MPAAAKPKPHRTYEGLQMAYDYFNRGLFGDELPPCLITMQRHPRALGYFSPDRFAYLAGDQSDKVDEIALNPEHFRKQGEREVLSTLVHEMAHLWQQHFGKPSRGGYHNGEWAAKMKQIGLHPSSTAAPGGKEVGPAMSHYIVEGGPFDKLCDAFLKSGKSAHLYGDVRAELSDDAKKKGEQKKASKSKYTCGSCGLNAWAKPAVNLGCWDCGEQMKPEEPEGSTDGED